MQDGAATFFAGGASGMTVDFVLYPLDTIKTRLQTKGGGKGALNKRGFYSGLLSAMLGSFPGAATFWTAYTASKGALAPYVGSSDAAAGLLHGAAAGLADVAVVAVRNPFEVVKQQMQAGLHGSTASAVRAIVAKEGVAGLYAGYFSTVLREVPFDAAQFMLYEHMKGKLARARGRDLVLWENAALGSVAGGFAAAVTTPLDVVKTRLMTQVHTPAAERYKGVWDGLVRIAAEEGVGALFSGIVPRVAWISLGGAIFIGSFEEFRRRLSSPSPSQHAP